MHIRTRLSNPSLGYILGQIGLRIEGSIQDSKNRLIHFMDQGLADGDTAPVRYMNRLVMMELNPITKKNKKGPIEVKSNLEVAQILAEINLRGPRSISALRPNNAPIPPRHSAPDSRVDSEIHRPQYTSSAHPAESPISPTLPTPPVATSELVSRDPRLAYYSSNPPADPRPSRPSAPSSLTPEPERPREQSNPSPATLSELPANASHVQRPANLTHASAKSRIEPPISSPALKINSVSQPKPRQHSDSSLAPKQSTLDTRNELPVHFRSNPFYASERSLSPQLVIPATNTDRLKKTTRVTLRFTLKQYDIDRISRDDFQVLIYAADQSTLKPKDNLIVYPEKCSLSVNQHMINATEFKACKGIKTRPGTARPVDITQHLQLHFRMANLVDITVEDTKIPFVFMAVLARPVALSTLVNRIKRQPMISKACTVQMIIDSNDDDVTTISTIASLKCPISYGRLIDPVRSVHCNHVDCFDVSSFLQLQLQATSWSCPICNKALLYEELALDEYMLDVLDRTKSYDLDEIQIDSMGRWSMPKGTKLLSDSEESDSDSDRSVAKSGNFGHRFAPLPEEILEISDSDEEDHADSAPDTVHNSAPAPAANSVSSPTPPESPVVRQESEHSEIAIWPAETESPNATTQADSLSDSSAAQPHAPHKSTLPKSPSKAQSQPEPYDRVPEEARSKNVHSPESHLASDSRTREMPLSRDSAQSSTRNGSPQIASRSVSLSSTTSRVDAAEKSLDHELHDESERLRAQTPILRHSPVSDRQKKPSPLPSLVPTAPAAYRSHSQEASYEKDASFQTLGSRIDSRGSPSGVSRQASVDGYLSPRQGTASVLQNNASFFNNEEHSYYNEAHLQRNDYAPMLLEIKGISPSLYANGAEGRFNESHAPQSNLQLRSPLSNPGAERQPSIPPQERNFTFLQTSEDRSQSVDRMNLSSEVYDPNKPPIPPKHTSVFVPYVPPEKEKAPSPAATVLREAERMPSPAAANFLPEAARAPSPAANATANPGLKRTVSEVIDLTLSDDEEEDAHLNKR